MPAVRMDKGCSRSGCYKVNRCCKDKVQGVDVKRRERKHNKNRNMQRDDPEWRQKHKYEILRKKRMKDKYVPLFDPDLYIDDEW